MPEISLNDEFGQNITKVIEENNYTHNLEIGSWDGLGSTQCFIYAMEKLSIRGVLQCIEINKDRYESLVENVKNKSWIQVYNTSSIGKDSFIPKSFEEIWNSPYNKLETGELIFPKYQVEEWYNYDIPKLPNKGFLESIYKLNKYDTVLIDGSEFTGYSEFKLLKNITKCFFLDDVFHAYKCNQVYYELIDDPNWELLYKNENLRNGYAIFRRK